MKYFYHFDFQLLNHCFYLIRDTIGIKFRTANMAILDFIKFLRSICIVKYCFSHFERYYVVFGTVNN